MTLTRRESVSSQFISEVPGLKVKRLTGTTAATEGAGSDVTHGLNADKVIAWIASVKFDDNTLIPEGFKVSINQEFNAFLFTDTQFRVFNITANSSGILSKPFEVLLFYTD